MNSNARLILVFSVSVILIAITVQALPLVPVKEWKATFNYNLDAAWAVDASGGTIAVVGNQGLVIYDESGDEKARVETNTPQRAVIVVGERVFTGGADGLSAYNLTGKLLWSRRIDGGCQRLALLGEETLLALSGGKIVMFSLTGSRVGAEQHDLVAIATRGTTLVTARAEQLFYIKDSELIWRRTEPFSASDLALDATGDVWAVGDGSVWLISGVTGSIVWEREFPGIPTAICISRVQGEQLSLLGSPDVAVITGYMESDKGKDYSTIAMSHDGELIWRDVYDNGHGDDIAYDVATTAKGEVVVTGSAADVASNTSGSDYLTLDYALQPIAIGEVASVSSSQQQPPIADFSYSPDSPYTYTQISFKNLSHDPDGMIVAFAWSFEDDSQARTENAKHAYLHTGDYDVTLTVVDDDGLTGSCTKTVHVANRPPEAGWKVEVEPSSEGLTADFDWSVKQEKHGFYPAGFEPEEATDLDDIVFSDLSTVQGGISEIDFVDTSDDWDGEITSWAWEFGDGETSDEQNPIHHYAESGTYHVVLTVTDNDGATGVYEKDVDVEQSGGDIVSWEWDFGDDGSSNEQNPTHWFRDNSTYPVTLTVQDADGNSDSVTKEIDVINVPPVGDFQWYFDVPEDFMPGCSDLVEWQGDEGDGGEEGDYWGTVCQEPEIPKNAGVVQFDNELSTDVDGEIVGQQWAFGEDGECWDEEGECESAPSPRYIYLSEDEEYLYRGDVDVTLQVEDDDGDTSSVTKTVTLDNVPPYAIFDWEASEWDSFSELDCSACEQGDPEKSGSNEQVTVTRTIYSGDCGEEAGSAVAAPWTWGIWVELGIEGSGILDLTETIPAGWYYSVDWADECVTITQQEDGYWSATVDLDACEGITYVEYELYPPFEGPTGTYNIHGEFSTEDCSEEEGCVTTGQFDLDSHVVLCAVIDVEQLLYLYGYGKDDIDIIDPNGDDIISWNWNLGDFGSAEGQDPNGGVCYDGECELSFQGLPAQYDEERGEWIWSYDLPVSLTVTDEVGGYTTAETVINLRGACGGEAAE